MGQERVASSIQVKVALIGVVSAISVALISNWNNFAPVEAPAVASAPAAVLPPAPMPSALASASPAPASAAIAASSASTLGAAETRAYDAGAAALDQVAAKIETASAPDVTGTWRDSDGYAYRLVQQGGRFAFIQLQDGIAVGAGGGTIDGRTLDYRFTGGAGNGVCQAMVAPSGDTIEGQCSAGGLPWTFVVTRESGAAS